MPGHCAVVAAMRDLDEIYTHMREFCVECVQARLAEAANGEELIFTDGPPSWIAEQEALAATREAEEKAEREKEMEMERKRKAIEKKRERNGEGTKVNWASTEEAKKAQIRKFAGELSDKHLEHEIKKLMKVDDAEAAQMRLDLKRELALKRKEKEKEKVKEDVKQQLKQKKEEQKQSNPEGGKEIFAQKRPWQPAIVKGIALGDSRRSALSTEEQKRYVAIVSNFHHIDPSTRFEQNKVDLKMYDDRLAEERVVVEGIVKEQLQKENVSMKELQTEINHVLQRWASRYLHDQRRYEKMKTIQWRRESEPSTAGNVLKPALERFLMAATNPKLTLPMSMHDRLHVNYTPHRFDPRNKQSTNIFNDKTLHSLCVDTGCSIAMECTTAVHLMARPAEPRNYAYNIPVSVFEEFRGGSIMRVCFLGKPRPQSGVSNQTLLHMVAKYRVKSTFTKKEDAPSKSSTNRDKVSSKNTVAATEGGGDSLLDDLLGSIMVPSSSSSALSGGVASGVKQSTTDYSYGIFTIPSSTQSETKVIIRSSPCLRNDATGGTEYGLTAKVEFAAEAGVMRETFEQMLWNSMKTVFKGAVNSAVVHMHPFMKDALQISHSRAIPTSNQYIQDFFPLLSTRTEQLSGLLRELSELQTGEYILQVSPLSDEMSIFIENPTGNELFFRKAPVRISAALKVADTYTGIDDKRVLHWQVMQGRAPLSLWPEGHHILKTYEAREKKEEEKERKRKRPNMTIEEKKQDNFNKTRHKRLNKRRRGGAQGQGWPRKDLDAP